MKTQILYLLLIFCLAFTTSSCGDVFLGIAKGLGEKNCTDKAKIPAGPEKRVLLFAKNHIYVVGQDTKYDPNYMTKHPYLGKVWKNEDIVKCRNKQIAEFFPKMNKILEDNGANIYVHNSGSDIRVVTQEKIQGDFDSWSAKGYTASLAYDLITEDSKFIHILWLWTSQSAEIAVGQVYKDGSRFIAIGDDPKYGTALNSDIFSHEMVHALGFETHVNDPSNLMNEGPGGTKLTLQQLQVIWGSLNQPGDVMLKLSCDK